MSIFLRDVFTQSIYLNRFECRNMWGSVHLAKQLFKHAGGKDIQKMVVNEDHDVIVDKPARTKGIFEGCEWKPFVSNG